MVTGALIVARMDSRRFHGKVLARLLDEPVLGWVVDRLGQSHQLAGRVAVATTDRSVDDPIAEFCRNRAFPVWRSGRVNDVAGRLAEACRELGWDGFLRVNADSPLVDAGLVEMALDRLEKTGADMVTNLLPRTWPYGISAEGLRLSSFVRAYERYFSPGDREHVTSWFYANPEHFHIECLKSGDLYNPAVRMTVDTEEDLMALESVLSEVGDGGTRVHFSRVYHKLSQSAKSENQISAEKYLSSSIQKQAS
jgi:spore coat polysaccharide biosynthesis protein SpsF